MAEGIDDVIDSGLKEARESRKASDSWPFVNKLTGLVGLLATLATICFGASQLAVKSKADEAAAESAKNAEINRLKISTDQIEDQKTARSDQFKGDKEKRRFERESAEMSQARLAEQQERQELSSVITRLLTTAISDEGDLAVLSRFTNRSAVDDDILESAVVARLENPRSVEEVDLGFHLLERIGVNALGATAQANRSARSHYESCLRNAVLDGLGVQPLPNSSTAASKIDDLAHSAAKTSVLDQVYVMPAARTSLLSVGIFAEGPDVESIYAQQTPSAKTRNAEDCRSTMNVAVIKRSNQALQREMDHALADKIALPQGLDLSDTYLSINFARYADTVMMLKANVHGAYIETASLRTVSAARLFRLASETSLGELMCSEQETGIDGKTRWYLISLEEDARRFDIRRRASPFSR